MTNVFNIFENLFINIDYIVMSKYNSKGQWNLISSAGESEHF